MKYLLAFLLSLAAVSALQFTSPADGATYTAPATVTFAWDAQAVNVTFNGTTQAVNTSNMTYALGVGTHAITINDSNQTATRTVIVSAPAPTQIITITTDKQSYEVLSSARIRVTAQTPGQLNLIVQRDGVTVDTYSINVQQQTDFLYSLLAAGQYSVIVSGQSASASTSFSVTNTSVSVSITGSSSASTGKLSSYSALVYGGSAPYTYSWQFSDATSSTGQQVEHVFSTNGSHNMTVVVTDATGKTASASKAISVSEAVYELEVTVMDQHRRLLRNAPVILERAGVGRTIVTNQFGEAEFKNLSAANYSVNVSYLDYGVSPARGYNTTRTLEIDENEDITIVFALIENTTNTTTTTTVTNTSNTTTTTPAPAATSATTEVNNTTTEVQTAKLVEPTLTSEEELERIALDQSRSEQLDKVRQSEATIARSAEKQELLSILKLNTAFSQAPSRIQQAATEYELSTALANVPSDIEILSKDTNIEARSIDDIQDNLEEFFAARAITEKSERKQYAYNIEKALESVSVTAKRSVVKVSYHDGSTKTFTVFTRTMVADDATTYLEFIPKSVASDASKLFVEGSHEVIKADPIIRFMSSSYSYYVEGNAATEQPMIVPLPFELQEQPSLVGLVAVKLRLDSFERGGWYLMIIGALIGVAVLGNVYLRRRASSTLPEFTQLADLAISHIAQGNYEVAAKYHKHFAEIHATLTKDEQIQTKEIVTFIAQAADVHEFRAAAEHLRNVVDLHDTVAISTAFERLATHYALLAPQHQANEKTRWDESQRLLEQHIEKHV